MGAMTLAYYDTVSGNTGGGIRNLGTLILTGSTISGNSTDFIGGGINNSGTLTVTDSTISGNTGGGINNHGYFVDGTLVYGTLSLTNSTISVTCRTAALTTPAP